MPSRWCWWRAEGSPKRRLPGRGGAPEEPGFRSFEKAPAGLLLLGGLFLSLALHPVSAGAAALLEKRVRHAVQADGSVRESITLRVRLESEAELASWSPFPVYLDENRTLEEIATHAVRPDGERIVVKPKDHDEAEVAGYGELHSSRRYRLVEFPGLPAGSELVIAYTVREEPYFPGGAITLGEDIPVAALAVEITGAPGLAWRIDGDTRSWEDGALRVEEGEGRLRVVGEGLPAVSPPDLAPGDAAGGPVLRYTWGGEVTWPGVAAWYQGLVEGLPAASGKVAERARELVAGVEDRRRRLETLLSFASRKVRYVAVEMGVGGYRPSPPPETLERGWGDCKDKSTLLVEMLVAAGIEAYPALVLSARDRRVDPALPSPYQFNHAIVAVPAEGLGVGEDDPVAGGYLFLDPTHEEGTSRWLHPAVQDQDALVVRGEGSALVRTPRLFHRDRRELAVELELDGGGGARGTAELALTGRWGSAFTERLAGERADRVEEAVRSVLARVLPAANLSRVGWGEDLSGGAPRAVIQAAVVMPALVQGSGEHRSLRLPGIEGTPSPAVLEERGLPVVLSPGVTEETWRLRLPAGVCPPEGKVVEAANELGTFRQTVAGEGGELIVERHLELTERWVEPDAFEALGELALAETRARNRRVRFGPCGGG